MNTPTRTLTIKKRKKSLADFVYLTITMDSPRYDRHEWVFDADSITGAKPRVRK